MNICILFTIFVGLTVLVGLKGEIYVFAQSITPQTDQVRDNNQPDMNRTNETTGNVTKGLIGVANGTGNAAGNITEGLVDAVNETGEALSNTTKGTLEGIQIVVNGSSQ
ncbi:MAG TPA: hypothetical protein VJR94_10430 [Candidatus Nitrosocosmicus sp.]|nr:hypothetical protein [Candidatus Nitrosocosmicus sp.]